MIDVNVDNLTSSPNADFHALILQITNWGGGDIAGNAIINFAASGNVDAQGNALFQIYNFNDGGGGGMINGNAIVDVDAVNISTAGVFYSVIGNNDNGNAGGGGTIVGDAMVNVSAGNINAGSLSDGIFNSGGSIGGSANLAFSLTGDLTTQAESIFQIANNDDGSGSGGGTIGTDATINVAAANISMNSLLAQIDNTGGSIGGNATINMNVSGSATVTNDATVAIYGSDGAASAAINVIGGTYNVGLGVGGTFTSSIDGNGTITFNNASAHADVLKVGALGTNGVLNIGGGTLSADTTLKLYAPGSNGQLNFLSNVTLGGTAAKILAANTVNIFNGVTVTIGGSTPADVYTNNANYTGFGGNGSRTGTFAGAGANNPQPLGTEPAFDDPPVILAATSGTTSAKINTQTLSGITSSGSVATSALKTTSKATTGTTINISSSNDLLSMLDGAGPGRGGKITIPASSKIASNGRNSSRIDAAGRLNAVRDLKADRRAMDMRTASSLPGARRLQP
jgi:hypothetical protein